MKVIFLTTLCYLLVAVQSFVPLAKTGSRLTTMTKVAEALEGFGDNMKQRKTALYSQPKQQEKELREELAERTSIVEDEEKYALRDGPGVLPQEEVLEEPIVTIPEGETEGEKLKRRMEKLTRRRAYPLFLAEKGIEIVESIIPTEKMPPAKREKIVVLGTGWGAVSFLKSVDTSLYDVTVISPRNYFLFTPMLGMLYRTVWPFYRCWQKVVSE